MFCQIFEILLIGLSPICIFVDVVSPMWHLEHVLRQIFTCPCISSYIGFKGARQVFDKMPLRHFFTCLAFNEYQALGFAMCQVLNVQNNWQIVNTNLSRYRSQSLQVLLDNAQGDSIQDSRTSALQKEDFRICLVRLIERQARSIKIRIYRILIKLNNSLSPLRIRVSNLLLLVYKGNPKHVFIRLLERKECASFCIQDFVPKSSLISSIGVIP